MKTKHLFLATALVASLAACTNEEIVDVQQQNIAKSRPTVDNVELNFGVGAESRVVYDGSWKWNATDTIGALLMDVIKTGYSESAAWHNKYQLTQYVQTSYPFTYNEGVWSCNTKMLEGNYFFAYPWSSYDGARQVKHSLINQTQTGITADVRAKAYADNNLFIGYQQIVAGTQAADVLDEVEMWGVLGAIQLQIKNTGTQNYHINKVVLSGSTLKSTLTFDPHDQYSYSPTNDNSTVWLNDFNYANYFGWDEDPIFVKTAEENKYNREEAILKVVNTVSNPEVDGFAQVVIEGEEDERALIANAGNTAYVMIMANPATISSGGLKLSIYTDEGVVSDIDLTSVHVASADYKVITSAKVKEIGPNVKNTIAIQIDDNSFSVPETMQVFNTNDLEQLLQWNAATPGAREVVAILQKNVKFTEDMLEVLENKSEMELTVKADNGEYLTLADGIPANILENEQLTVKANIEVEGELELTKNVKSTAIPTIVVLEGGELIINDAKAVLPTTTINNYGTLTVGNNANIKSTGACGIDNYGEMNVAKAAIIKTSTVNNYGELNVEGRIYNVATNGTKNINKDVKVTLGEEGVITIANNYGTVETKGNLEVTANYGKVYYKDGDLDVTNKTGGETFATLPNKVNKNSLKDLADVNVWIASGDVEFNDEENAVTLEKVLVEGTADITVDEDAKTVTVKTLEVEGDATIEKGVITISTIKVAENGVFNVEDDATVKGDAIANKGLIDIDGILYSNEAATGEGDIRGDISAYPTAAPTDTPALKAKRADYNKALRAAIMNWVNNDYIVKNTHNLNASSIKAADWNLNKAEKEENGVVVEKSAKTLFGEYVKAHTDRSDYWGEDDMKSVAEKFAAYVTSYTSVYGAKAAEALTITDGYALAVDTLLAEYQGNIYDEDNAVVKYDEAKDKFKVLKAALEWNVEGLADGFSRIYVDTKDEKNNTITAETNALKAFQEAIVDGSVTKADALEQEDITMMMTLGGNYAPACSQVFKTDNVYKIFEKIKMLEDWNKSAGFTGAYNISELTSETLKTTGWSCKVIRQWIDEAKAYDVTKTDACPEAVLAHNYIVANDFAIYFEAKEWTYDQEIIRAIVGDYLKFNVADIKSVLP